MNIPEPYICPFCGALHISYTDHWWCGYCDGDKENDTESSNNFI